MTKKIVSIALSALLAINTTAIATKTPPKFLDSATNAAELDTSRPVLPKTLTFELASQVGYFVPAEEIERRVGWPVEDSRIVLDDGEVLKTQLELPQGDCVVITNQNDGSFRMALPLTADR